MAPGALIYDDGHPIEAVQAGKFRNNEAPTSVFPSGIRTSGQHPPLYDLLKQYEEFPTEITGPTVWEKKAYQEHPEQWTHHFSEDEIQELSEAADRFIANGIPLTGIAKVRLKAHPPVW